MGVASCFGNDVDTFYDRWSSGAPCARLCVLCCALSSFPSLIAHNLRSLLAGKSGVGMIDRFDASEFPTKFAAQIRNFSADGCGET